MWCDWAIRGSVIIDDWMVLEVLVKPAFEGVTLHGGLDDIIRQTVPPDSYSLTEEEFPGRSAAYNFNIVSVFTTSGFQC